MVDAIQRRLLEKVDGVLAVHEFHVWQLAGDRIIASAHIRCRNLSEYMKIAEKVKEFFHNEGIHSTTIQPEFVELPLGGNEEQSTPSPTVTPYLCRQRTMGSRTESMCSTNGAGAPRQATTWNLEALECGLVE
ncbi:hypothetical protein HF086_007596 [Spodoptera exigua]|uniref:Cation efflux protein cytoplasmic domain-containing protein n=1 Tax=Spodoptera exigua TaxID=7107 RepID=A0A922MTI3_SPOEX|nr:hypothetical protein HF086_007596 [Spodoptera exigua]